ncbi:protein kinase [Aureobasidium sp. EXF-8845]|nr:protein kinase [Aureobasidium sp. EXF-8845]KAI4847445.1 protein kinase [Aureobasidium sp. EXF-8846]
MLRALKRWSSLGRWQPLEFNNANFARTPLNQAVEEETIPDYVAARYYPVRIGEVFQYRYQVVSKLGFGACSTAWLARDMDCRRYVTLKMYISNAALGKHLDNETKMYRRIAKGSKSHPGRQAIRSLLDSFDVDGLEEPHHCLVHSPLCDNLTTFLHRNPVRRLPKPILAFVLYRLFLALDYLHRECQIIHTGLLPIHCFHAKSSDFDIKPDNIMFTVPNDLIFQELEQNELCNPAPRKELDGRTIYLSSELGRPTEWCPPVLCDFDSAVLGNIEHTEDVQPNIYRAPEVILEAPWTYSVDVWNVGCMIWDLSEGGSLFTGHDQQDNAYRSRAHLAEMMSLLGPPPSDLLTRGSASSRFFSSDGNLITKSPIPDPKPLELRENTLEGEEKARFLRLMSKMLCWEPSERSPAQELINDEWIHS